MTQNFGFFRSIRRKDKPRLYVALYVRDGTAFRTVSKCESYHWALIVSSRSPSRHDPGTRYDVHQRANSAGEEVNWHYEEQEMRHIKAQMVLARITVAKVKNIARLEKLLRDIPLRDSDPAWNCLTWVRSAFRILMRDHKAIKTFLTDNDWTDVELCARRYVQQKREQGRYQDEGTDHPFIPTWNYWERRETSR